MATNPVMSSAIIGRLAILSEALEQQKISLNLEVDLKCTFLNAFLGLSCKAQASELMARLVVVFSLGVFVGMICIALFYILI